MSQIENIKNEDVKNTILLYPKKIQKQLLAIRKIIFDLQTQHSDIAEIEETLKWGEPSYLTKSGSTIRISWKKSSPEQYGIYFNCKSKLVDTYKEIYPNEFTYEGNRAIILKYNQIIPRNELSQCLLMALTYHKIKHLNLLGA